MRFQSTWLLLLALVCPYGAFKIFKPVLASNALKESRHLRSESPNFLSKSNFLTMNAGVDMNTLPRDSNLHLDYGKKEANKNTFKPQLLTSKNILLFTSIVSLAALGFGHSANAAILEQLQEQV